MREYIIENLIPCREISLIYGPSGAGKTRYMFDIMRKILNGNNICVQTESITREFQCHAQQIAYLSYDRSTESCQDLLSSFGLSHIPWYSFRNLSKPDCKEEEHPLSDLRRYFPSPNIKCVFVDGLGMTIPGKTGDYRSTGNYMRYLGKVAEEQDFAIIGSLHTPKQRQSDKILNPRQMALGSSALGGCAETMIYFDHVDPSNVADPRRFAYLIPHDGSAVIQWLEFNNDGFLAPVTPSNSKPTDLFSLLPENFTRKQTLEVGGPLSLNRIYVDRLIKSWLELGKIKKNSTNGHYQKT